MIDIYNLPLYYISFNRNFEIENYYKNYGFKNVNHFQAVNGKKLNPEKLLDDKIISLRSYDDLIGTRIEHSGMTSLGAIGCSLSHYNLWQICLHKNYPYIIIAEEDNKFTKNINEDDLKFIKNVLSFPKSMFVSSEIKNRFNMEKHFFGTHFYIISKEACEELINKFFPIDVQIDWYISNMASRTKISLYGYYISDQEIHPSSIQDDKSTIIEDINNISQRYKTKKKFGSVENYNDKFLENKMGYFFIFIIFLILLVFTLVLLVKR